MVLVETVRAVGLDAALSQALRPCRKPLAVHDPAKMVLDLAVALVLGRDCLADHRAAARATGGVRALRASEPAVSRTVDALATDVTAALVACGQP